METQMSSLPYTQLCRRFTLDEILSATKNFDDALVVGEGGFGKVYKASISVENGEDFIVAIKRLNFNSSQGAKEFWAEIEMLTKLRHCNLVSLIGYCNDNTEMILIYEFMPNGTLDDHLHRCSTSMSWVQRLKISIGATRGLHYLHTGAGTQHGIVHRDVKSANILLDEDFAAKISDFGLSKISPTNAAGTYVNTLVRGTFGYLDPQYSLTGRLTRKSDVFAFGVVLFELLCGRVAVDRNLDEDKCSLAQWAHESIERGKVYEIIDFNISSQISPKCLKIYVQIADRCLSCESKKRPTMAEILVALELCLTVQNKFDSHVKLGILSIARMIKWPFISTEDNSAQTKSPDEDKIYNASSSKEHSDDHLKVSCPKIQILAHELKSFSFNDLENATKNFTRMLGKGEFGELFEGWIDTNTSSMSGDGPVRIAIRRFYQFTRQSADMINFLISEFNHPNLVKVLGYCFRYEEVFLIYEFMENGSLDFHLFKNKMPLTWRTRVQIAKGVAEAISFLYRTQSQIQNRPVELHQILLDKNFNAKISDFESARLVYGDLYLDIIDPMFCITPPAGKSVFDGIIRPFGVMLIHILTGERFSEIGILKLQKTKLTGKDYEKSMRSALDPRLPNVDNTTIEEATKLAEVALGCVHGKFTVNEALDAVIQL